jgi:4-amino-4-deoxy-L-arabinose transferase-like glycosyltransferase
MRVVWTIAGAKLALHLAFASRYGYFGDELYHLACGEHLAWGYVDQPPLIALIAWLVRNTFGDSLLAVRLLPALAGAGLVVLAGMMAREMGAKAFGMALAALSTGCIGVLITMHYIFTMNAFEPVFWMGCAYLVLRIVNSGNQRLWLWFGLLAGLGLQNKYSMAVFGGGVILGVLLTHERKAFSQRWIWLGGALAALIFLPNVAWNVANNWPFFELMRNIRESGRDVQLSPIGYLLSQIFLIGPIHLPIWLAGLVFLFLFKAGRPYRSMGYAFLFVLAFFILTKGKNYYAAPAFPLAIAAGAVCIERVSAGHGGLWRRATLVGLLVVTTGLGLPIGLPVLSAKGLIEYLDSLPFTPPVSEHDHRTARIPHHFAWQFGWEEMVATVAEVYHGMPPHERAKAAIFASNFAQAGAIDLMGPRHGLPKAICGHQSYWLWGPRDATGEVTIVIGATPESLTRTCDSVELGAELNNPYARPRENRPILICRNARAILPGVWPRLKEWN